MSIFQSPRISTYGLVFNYDINNSKSFKGKPTTNFAYTQNARPDSSYIPYVQTSSGTWSVHHPDAIRAYNYQGSDITGYVNTGVGDYTNTYHAIWTYDRYLNKPVVTMRDVDRQWKAKSFGLGQTMTSMGLSYGSMYTISWLQWTDDIAKSVNAGLYGLNTSGVNNFYDGLSNSFGTSYNTKSHTWQRVHATFTVSSSWNLSAGLSCYMYGHYIKRGTVKIADVQIESGTLSGFVDKGEVSRTNTQNIIDLTNNNTITAVSLTYASDGTFSFNGSDVLTIPNSSAFNMTEQLSIEAWVKFSGNSDDFIFEKGDVNTQYSLFSHGTDIVFRTFHSGDGSYHTQGPSKTTAGIVNGQWVHIVGSWDGATKRIYVNGVLKDSVSKTGALVTTSKGSSVGRFGGDTTGYYFNGSIAKVAVYNIGLTESQVLQNFNAQRGIYGV